MKINQLTATAITGLIITIVLHVFNTAVLNVGFAESINSWVGVYCAWTGLLIGGLMQKRKTNKDNI